MNPNQATLVAALAAQIAPPPVDATADIPGRPAPIAGFEGPLEMLCAGYRHVEEQCSILRHLVSHVLLHGSDATARDTATGLMRCFDPTTNHLHADEEVDLFPALIESMAGSDAVCIRDLTEALTAEHRELEARWRRLRGILERIAVGEAQALESTDVESLAGLHERHIAREEAELLPMASRLLSDVDLERIGRAMRERRGVAAQGCWAICR